MSKIVFNIETIADPELPAELLPDMPTRESIKPHGGIKDPVKQAEFIEKGFQSALAERVDEIAKFGLHPLTSKIICIGYKQDNEDIQCFAGDDEAQLMNVFQTMMAQPTMPILVGFNSKLFDIRHIAIATTRHDISVSFVFPTYMRKYDTDWHIDLYHILSNFGEDRRGKLSDWCYRFGITPPFGKGDMVAEWHQKSDWDSIKHHCSDNVRCTYELLQKVSDII
jgi:Predicted 3'-5' exonuclease related to the exonuclease domain of PolB